MGKAIRGSVLGSVTAGAVVFVVCLVFMICVGLVTSGSASEIVNIASEEYGTVVRVSDASAQFPASNVNDGDINTGWQSTPNWRAEEWVELSWPRLMSISKVRLYSVPRGSRILVLRSYYVEVWQDNRWVSIPGMPVTGNEKFGQWLEHSFVPIATSKLRVRITRGQFPACKSLAEIEVYGQVAREPKPTAPIGKFEVYEAHLRADFYPRIVEESDRKYFKVPGAGFQDRGSLHLYLRNTGKKVARVGPLQLNGKSLKQWQVKFGTDNFGVQKVAWHWVWPEMVEPGGVAQVIIRFRQFPEGDTAHISVGEGANQVSTKISLEPASLRIGHVSFSPHMDTLYVYLEDRDEAPTVERVELDGKPVPKQDWHSPGSFQRLTPLKIRLPKGLEYGSYHVLKVTDKQRKSSAERFRAWDSPYVVAMIGDNQAFLEDFGMHGCNALVNMWQQIGRFMTPMGSKAFFDLVHLKGGYVILSWKDRSLGLEDHPALLGYNLEDEPDARDDPENKGRTRYLGRWAKRFMEEDIPEILRRDRRNFLWVNMDNTVRPYNFYTYGECVDVYMGDHYPIWISYAPLTRVRAIAKLLREASRPRPWGVTLEIAHRLDKREVTAGEVDVMSAYAVGCGAKAIWYWIYCSGQLEKSYYQGQIENRQFVHDFGRINHRIRRMGSLLAHAYDVDAVRSAPKKIWASTLLCQEKAIVLVVVNERYQSDAEGFNVQPQRNVKVSMEVPSWFKPGQAYQVDAESLVPIAYEHKGQNIEVSLPSLERTAYVVLLSEGESWHGDAIE